MRSYENAVTVACVEAADSVFDVVGRASLVYGAASAVFVPNLDSRENAQVFGERIDDERPEPVCVLGGADILEVGNAGACRLCVRLIRRHQDQESSASLARSRAGR